MDNKTANEEVLDGHQVRSVKSTRALLRAAGDIISEGGYQAMTLATVGERAGYSRSLATARFGSKAKLLEALVNEIVVRWSVEKMAPETEGLTGLAQLRALLSGIRDSYEKNPRSLAVLYALIFEALGPVTELRERFIRFNNVFREQIAGTIHRGIEDKSIRPDADPQLQATIIIAQLRGVGYLWRLDPDTLDTSETISLFIEDWLKTLRPLE